MEPTIDYVILGTPEADEFLASFAGEGSTEPRFNKAHDKAGKFATHTGSAAPTNPVQNGLSEEQWHAITPGQGRSATKARAALAQTDEGKALLSAVSDWQNSIDKCKGLQSSFMKGANGKKLTKADGAKAKALMNGISKSPVSPPLYRGSRFPAEEYHTLVPGKAMILPPSSFTSSSRMAGGFAKQVSRRKVVPVVFRVPKGARGLPIEVFGSSQYKSEKEWISAGQFTITKVSKRSDGVTVVDVDHTAMFSWGS